MSNIKTVIILKSESESSENYAKQLTERNFNPIFVPTLGFGFKKLDELKEKLFKPDNYSGIIFTSPRSVEAIKEALDGCDLPDGWKKLHNYCVGEVTHNLAWSGLNELSTKGKDTGNATNLADFINEQFDGNKSLPFLFPCGNLRTDTLLSKLTQQGFLIDACEVYETICHPDLEENLNKAIALGNVEYLAFFSPSGVNCCYDYFKKNNIKLDDKKLIAIGPSTRKCIEGKGLVCYRTCEKPSVEYLIKVLLNPDDQIKPKEIE